MTDKELPSSNSEEVRGPDKQQPPPSNGGRREEQEASYLTAVDHTARKRLRVQQHAIRNATLCHLAGMDLARYYRSGLLDMPLSRLLAWGRWAA